MDNRWSMKLLLVAMTWSCCCCCWSSSTVSNVFFTGEVLANQTGIGLPGVGSFIMQLDCNLVLYDSHGVALFHTNTACCFRRYCKLSFTDNGRLVIKTPDGSQLWISGNGNSPVGNYAAVFRPDGDVKIYGPAIWSTGDSFQSERQQKRELVGNIPLVENMIFSGQVLFGNGELKDNYGSTFQVTNECELVLNRSGNVWSTLTRLAGKDCFARLNFVGELALLDDEYNPVWRSSSAAIYPSRGEYVLIVSRGMAQIYGPPVWSTNFRHAPNAQPVANLIVQPSVALK